MNGVRFCQAKLCASRVAQGRLMCDRHWGMVPDEIKADLELVDHRDILFLPIGQVALERSRRDHREVGLHEHVVECVREQGAEHSCRIAVGAVEKNARVRREATASRQPEGLRLLERPLRQQLAQPAATMMRQNDNSFGAKAASAIRNPKAPAEPTTVRSRKVVRRVEVTAPVSAPTASSVLSSP